MGPEEWKGARHHGGGTNKNKEQGDVSIAGRRGTVLVILGGQGEQGVRHIEGPVLRLETRSQWAHPLTFQGKFRWYMHDMCAIQGDKILEDKRRRVWTSNYAKAGTNMYFLELDEVYQVRVVTSSTWVPKDKIWAPQVFILGKGSTL